MLRKTEYMTGMLRRLSFIIVGFAASSLFGGDLDSYFSRIPASRFHERTMEPVSIDPRRGLGPDDAALLALYLNPVVRATRDRRGLAVAQLVQAGVLPNPQVSYARDYVTGGNTAGTQTGFTASAGWEITSLLPLLPKRNAARSNLRSVDLDIAWNEWQLVANARTAVYRVVGLDAQLGRANEADRELRKSASALQKAVEAHEKTVLDQAAAESSSQDARATALAIAQENAKQRLVLKKTIGFAPDAPIPLRANLILPSHFDPPTEGELFAGLEDRRLDLIGLREGLKGQDATVRAATLAQFPKIAIGFAKASDTTNVHTSGFTITADVPIFDRNQGVLATEKATRQKLLDEHQSRLFEAKSDIAAALADIRSLNEQIAAAQEALPILERLVNSAESAVAERNTDVLAYYTARNSLLQKRIQVLKLQVQLLEARTALEIASGRFLPVNSSMRSK